MLQAMLHYTFLNWLKKPYGMEQIYVNTGHKVCDLSCIHNESIMGTSCGAHLVTVEDDCIVINFASKINKVP